MPAPDATAAAPAPAAPDTNATAVDTNAAAPDTNAAAPTTDSNALVPPPVDSNAPAANSGMGSPGENPPSSDPNALIPPAVTPEQASPINASGNEEKHRQEQKTRYYTVKTQADQDQDLAFLLKKVDSSKSEQARRETLREYYDLLAKRMKKIDPSISEWIDTMHAAYMRRLQVLRVEPTIPANLPPNPDATPTPSPTPKGKKKNSSNAEPSPTPQKKAD
jgi:hypothetical protein